MPARRSAARTRSIRAAFCRIASLARRRLGDHAGIDPDDVGHPAHLAGRDQIEPRARDRLALGGRDLRRRGGRERQQRRDRQLVYHLNAPSQDMPSPKPDVRCIFAEPPGQRLAINR